MAIAITLLTTREAGEILNVRKEVVVGMVHRNELRDYGQTKPDGSWHHIKVNRADVEAIARRLAAAKATPEPETPVAPTAPPPPPDTPAPNGNGNGHHESAPECCYYCERPFVLCRNRVTGATFMGCPQWHICKHVKAELVKRGVGDLVQKHMRRLTGQDK